MEKESGDQKSQGNSGIVGFMKLDEAILPINKPDQSEPPSADTKAGKQMNQIEEQESLMLIK